MSDNLLADYSKRGIKILQDCKTQRKDVPKSKSLPEKAQGTKPMDIHEATVKRFIKDKPNKKHLLEFFEKIIELEEAKL